MLNLKRHIALVIGATALFIGSANAHGWLSKPKSELPTDGDMTKYPAVIKSASLNWTTGLKFDGSPDSNTEAFWKGYAKSGYKDIRAFVMATAEIDTPGATLECGITKKDASPQPLPDKIEWSHSPNEGFTDSHRGPCVAYCDKKQVFHDKNCPKNFPGAPARMSYEMASCKGASLFTFIWIALHTPIWQVYISCAVLEGGGNETYTAETPAPSAETQIPPAEVPAPPGETQTPPAKTQTPPGETQTPSAETAEVPTPPAEVPTPPATPLAESSATQSDNEKSKEKCVRRRSRD